MKKMWIVKIEVRADTPEEAVKNRGRGKVYEVSLAEDKYQPEERQKEIFGFKNRKNG